MTIFRRFHGAWRAIDRPRAVLAGAAMMLLVLGCSPGASGAPSASPTGESAAPTVAPPAQSASASAEAGLTWLYGTLGFKTSVLRVPLDYADPDGEQIAISIARLEAGDPARRIGTLVYLPGGPGDPGVEALRDYAEFLFNDAVRERFDIVAFDARGNPALDLDGDPTDVLEPNVRCTLEGELPDIAGDPRTAPDVREQAMARDRVLAEACAAGSGEILPLLGTANVVQDLERLREALGEDQLSFVGISYGTVTGQRYAERYPDRVRAMILDAPGDLAVDGRAAARETATTLQGLFDAFLAACATDAACAIHNGGRPREAFEALVTRLAAAPLDGLSAADLWTIVAVGLRQPDQLDEYLAAIAAGDTAFAVALLQLFTEPDRLGYGTVMNCLDRDLSAVTGDDLVALREAAPDFAWLAELDPCPAWLLPAAPPPAPVRASGAPPILVVGATDDPATPYAWAEAVAGQLESGVLLTRVGGEHGSIFVADPCTDRWMDAYLIDLATPPPGTRCE